MLLELHVAADSFVDEEPAKQAAVWYEEQKQLQANIQKALGPWEIDPPLTATGRGEAQRARLPSATGTVYVSPFRRTLETAAELKLGDWEVRVHPELYEVGGVYLEREGRREGPGECMSALEIEREVPNFDTSALQGARDRGWYQGTWESDAAARQRCARLVQWLRQLGAPGASGASAAWVVLVIHGHLIDLLLKALLGIQDDPAEDQENENVMQGRRVVFFTPNCATAHVGLRPDGSVAVYHIGQSAKL
ncbi:unnamed protein product [Durusdinium trenchii]|uniref:Phosphoglycerate mutase n=1 Tax=Durusdinium trenchii TaxID=1381693 RepID=A0ABP0JH21_9DINO